MSWPIPGAGGAAPRYHVIGNQEWPTRDDFEFCLRSPEAAAAVADLDNFVDGGGSTILSCRTLVVA